ncbi:MAG TPA: HD domain-containing phosphohydrolase, partial [Thermoanaerobaculia bacterium]|nr:HD domain-containing phosphohydrolase [Thermoanaerobaculia bacterium]
MARFAPFSRPKLRHLLFLALLVSGIIPLVISNAVLVGQNRARLETEERTQLTQSAEALSREVSDQLATVRGAVHHLGRGLLLVPGPQAVRDRLRQEWVAPYLRELMVEDPSLLVLRVIGPDGTGPRIGLSQLPDSIREVRVAAFEEASREGRAVFRFAVLPPANEPVVSMAVPIAVEGEAAELVVEALVRLRLMEAVFRREAQADVGIFLIDGAGRVLWSEGASEEGRRALERSKIAQNFTGRVPLALTTEYVAAGPAGDRRMLAQVSPVGETGWAVVVQKPAAAAFAAVRRMVMSAAAATGLLVLLALVVAALAARRVSLPIQRLAETSHAIAAGSFGRRMEDRGLPAELSELARDFNRMSGHVERSVSQLQEAARVNRELFIGSIRAFAAAIDAKDPYTRGHSERVAALSRTIARHLPLSEDAQQKLWIAALLHDVGKIGVEDDVLRKVGQLTAEEFEQMKAHTVIGAEIMSSIEQLREMIPAIRWHHEAWNGRGYPDGKKGEEIPLFARVVAVA